MWWDFVWASPGLCLFQGTSWPWTPFGWFSLMLPLTSMGALPVQVPSMVKASATEHSWRFNASKFNATVGESKLWKH